MLAAIGLLVQGPEPLALAAVRLRGRGDDIWRRRGRRRCHRVQEVDDNRNEREGDDAVAIARLDVCRYSYHLELPGPLPHILVGGL